MDIHTEVSVTEIDELRKDIKTNFWEFWKKVRAIERYLDIDLVRNEDDVYIAVKKKDLK